MKKRILSLALALAMVVVFVPAAMAADTKELRVMGSAFKVSGVTLTEDIVPEIDMSGTFYWVTSPCVFTHVSGESINVYLWTLDTPADIYQLFTEDEETGFDWTYHDLSSGNPFTFKEGIAAVITDSWQGYLFAFDSDSTSTDTSAPTTPAPTVTTPASTAKLKTTAGLNSVIPPSPEKVTTVNSHKVGKGENLNSIAKKYGVTVDAIKTENKAYFDKLAEINKKNKTNVSLEAGAVLTLPANGLKAPVTQDSLNKAAGIYIVKSGDTLGSIANAYYGSMNEWKKIYEANKDKVKLVGNSPMIYVGQWLVIPE